MFVTFLISSLDLSVQSQGFATRVSWSWAPPRMDHLGIHVVYGGHHVKLHCQNLVIQVGAIVVVHGLFCVLRSLVGDCGRSQELSKFVTIEAADFQLANLLEQFLKSVRAISYLPLNRHWSPWSRPGFAPSASLPMA